MTPRILTPILLSLSLMGCASSTKEAAPEPVPEEATTQVAPFLMFQNADAEEAMKFYISLFEDGRIVSMDRYPGDGGAPEGTVQFATIEIAGQQVHFSDSPIKHGWDFTPGVSLFVQCSSEEEIERLAASLSEGGMTMMPLDNYGFSTKFAFIQDRFGVSWQINFG